MGKGSVKSDLSRKEKLMPSKPVANCCAEQRAYRPYDSSRQVARLSSHKHDQKLVCYKKNGLFLFVTLKVEKKNLP